MKNTIKNLVKSALIGAVSVLAVAGGANAATVSLTPSVTNVSLGDSFTLTVQGTDFATDVSAGSITVQWDSTAMTLTSTLADITTSAAINGFPVDFGVSSLVPGQLDATYSTFGVVAGPTFDFIELNFVAIPPPSATTLDILAGAFGDWQDGAGVSITPVTYVGASVNVSSVPVPAAVWLFGSGLLGMVGVARRRVRS